MSGNRASGNHTAAELAERLKSIRESIQQSFSTPKPEVRVDAPLLVSLDGVRQASQLAGHYAQQLGNLNPRPSGIANDLIQSGKGIMARSLDWMLRPQREFNQAVLQAVNEMTTAVEQSQHSVRTAIQSIEERHQQELQQMQAQLRELSEMVTRKLDRSDAETRESIRDLRWSYEGTLSRHMTSVEATRRRLNEEVRELNRRLAAQAKAAASRLTGTTIESTMSGPAAAPAAAPLNDAIEVDYFALEKDFRGTEEEIRSRQSFYLPYFKDCRSVLDIACGRGEFLELMKQAGVPATGVDLDADMVGRCMEKGLSVVQSDVFQHLAQIPDSSIGGIFCSQFVEHLTPADYTRLVLQAARKLTPGGVLAIETQNPECLAIFAKSFFIDPTHVKPIPAAQMRFLFEQAGLEDVTAHYLSPAENQLPLINQIAFGTVDGEAIRKFNQSVADFNAAFFGGMDYAVIGRRPGGN